MLEVNDFNAVRISLASPEQIRSWSYGEVTKPETINYRTLKPERDGLFCERIFGPTKDWECACGKYKRIRYKGMVCDKCGVEIAKSKVRRERMGHIELATPVSHIWYVKGTPSRLGLLLDLSPRELERVLYFAQYIITDIDEDQRRRALQDLDQETEAKIAKLQKATEDRKQEIERRLQEEIMALEKERKARLKELEARRLELVEEVIEAAKAMEDRLLREEGQIAVDPIMFTIGDWSQELVGRREVIGKAHLSRLRELTQERIETAERTIVEEEERIRAPLEAEMDRLRHVADQEMQSLDQRLAEDEAAVRQAARAQRDEIESLERLQLLSENRYRELQEKYGRIFKAGMGAEAIHDIVSRIDLDVMYQTLRLETQSSSGQRRKKATKRLRVVEAFRKSGNRPEWMIFTVLPVIPPDLRPMVQLDGGRFATSDLNDLYRRVINRNNRLKRLIELGAPEIIVRNEKRMLQEAVDALIDNGRRGRAVAGSSNHKLKSLSDMLKGKQGRFRQNLLGKRVDYSGRSVIVVGPELKLHQCGLPKKMALELFKPFVMRKLVEHNYAHNIKSAKRIVERMKPEVWDVLEEVIRDHPVLLNRAPTLHRLGIQAFEAVLIEGSAIQIHPLVCPAFNADFDGDQMAVHVPLSAAAKEEAKTIMLSTYNLLSPANGEPIVAPTKDMVLGCYYLTTERPGAKGEGKIFASEDEVLMAYHMGYVDIQARITVRLNSGEIVQTTPGRVIFNEKLPSKLRFKNKPMDKKALKELMAECFRHYGTEKTAELVDIIKDLGFHYATVSGTTIAISDITIPEEKARIIAATQKKIDEIERQYRRGLITEDEKYTATVEAWTKATEDVTQAVSDALDKYGSIYMMAVSGATRGQFQTVRQIAGMRGLMADPSGRIIDLPIVSNFREGLSVLEYFIATHGARKGATDTALRTADSGYLTRRLVDVAQNVIVRDEDCGTKSGIWINRSDEKDIGETMAERVVGRLAAAPIVHPKTGQVIVDVNQEIDEAKMEQINAAGIDRVYVRSPLTCQSKFGVCRMCYGRDLARRRLVELGEAVGIIAAQSIGEPGTQLTMRTFHTGGVAGGEDITQGLPRVEELFEARPPKGQAILSPIDGVVEIIRDGDTRRIKVVNTEILSDIYPLPEGYEPVVHNGDDVLPGSVLAHMAGEEEQPAPKKKAKVSKSSKKREKTDAAKGVPALPPGAAVTSRTAGKAFIEGDAIIVRYEERDEREFVVPPSARIRVESGQRVQVGDQLTDGTKNPQDILLIQGREAVQLFLLSEVQRVYRSQGVNINDKHIEIIIRQMLRRVQVDTPGDTQLLPGEIVDRFQYDEINARILSEGGEPATAHPVLLGVTKASLHTDSFLAAASFQETTRVLTEAAIQGATDRLMGLKENVIIGKLIPAGTGLRARLERMRHKEESLLARQASLAWTGGDSDEGA
jgi:DNA-directed RNA polymerase subunit beta'